MLCNFKKFHIIFQFFFTMKSFKLILIVFLLRSFANSQFKRPFDQTDFGSNKNTSSISIDWFDANRFSMTQNFSTSFISAGSRNISLTSYSNSMKYIFNDLLSVRADVSMMYSPNKFSWQKENSFSKIFLERAQINYQPSKNFLMRFEFRQIPFGMNNSYYFPQNYYYDEIY